MRPFAYRRADDVEGAVAMLALNPGAAFLGGGTNLVDHLRLGVTSPDLLVDVTRLGLDRIEALPDGGVRVGGTVRNSDLAADPLIRERYPVLAQALLSGASGQLRNLATTGGNLLQRTRCVYFQDVTTPCAKRDPGSGCSALHGYQRYHAILGASPACIATHPSDMAVAMAALDAVVRVRGRGGERTVPLTDFHRLPGDDPSADTVIRPDELITEVVLPPLPDGTVTLYRKARDRASFAFALASVAAVLRVRDGRIEHAALAFGGLAHRPWRARTAEEALRGAPATDAVYLSAVDAELAAARPLRDNAFKVDLARHLAVDALAALAARP